MLFNSLPFLYLFLPIAYLVFWRLTGKSRRYVWLAITGYVFYSFWNYKFCALMFFSTLVSYLAGRGLLRWQDEFRRRLCLIIPLTLDLGLLGIFKYTNFFVTSLGGLSSWLGVPTHFPSFDIVLPVGISFYTFHTVTYIVDSYKERITPTKSFAEFAAYVSLFPQLVAGPIVRFRQISDDLGNIDRAEQTKDLDAGWSFFVIGMIKKVLIADTIGLIITPALASYQDLSTLGAWLCVLGYAYQVYYDFGGYSDMAVGLGYMFGLRLPQNFNSPYMATNVADFWRRWHMSMSSFFRDYVYIPLGGSRGSRVKVWRNLMVTMLLAGLWHGANWPCVLWGGFIGLLLILHGLVAPWWERLPHGAQRAGTFFLFVVSLAIFRSDSLTMIRGLVGTMFTYHAGPNLVGIEALIAVILVSAALAHFGPNTFEMEHRWSPSYVAGFAALFVMCLFVMYGSAAAPFLYFQF
jgi:alginate O-acetyltransferase complex protein AlgI